MKKYQVVGGQYNNINYGESDSLHGAKCIATRNIEHIHNEWRTPSIWLASDCNDNGTPKPDAWTVSMWNGRKWIDSDKIAEKQAELGNPYGLDPSKVEVFYTGGGIWLSALYVDDNLYFVVDSDWTESITLFDHRDEDQDTEYPCQNVMYSKAEDSADFPFTMFEKAVHKLLVEQLNEQMN